MPSCVFSFCKNHSRSKNKSHGITFHSFPQEEPCRQKWVIIVREQRHDQDWIPTISSRVCSIHFKPNDLYTTNKGIKRLSKNAVPILRASKTTSTNETDSKPNISDIPDSLKRMYLSELESTFDTPRNVFLKKKLNRVIKRKREILQEKMNLKRKCNRLIEKCNNLRKTVIQLKKQMNTPRDTFTGHNFNVEAVDLYRRLIQNKEAKKGVRSEFSPSLVKFALTLHFYSPEAYNYMRNVFEGALPHPRTLTKWYEKADTIPEDVVEVSFEPPHLISHSEEQLPENTLPNEENLNDNQPAIVGI